MKSLKDTQTEVKLVKKINKLGGQTKAMEVRLMNRIQEMISGTEDKTDKIHTTEKMLNTKNTIRHISRKFRKH